MLGVHVEICRYVDDSQPGWVECVLTDAHGVVWRFIEKVPVVTTADLSCNSEYPQPGVVACEVVDRKTSGQSDLLVIDTELPWGVAATSGESRFVVHQSQILEFECGQ